MILQDEITLFRTITGETNLNGRWNNTDLAVLATESERALMESLEWPEANKQQLTNPTGGFGGGPQQEFPLPEIHTLLRVQLIQAGASSGQYLAPTSIPILSGEQIEFYDQTAANGTSQWSAQLPVVYPNTQNFQGFPDEQLPWFQGARPKYYLRGGNLGLVPAPANNPPITISIDVIPFPPTLQNVTDISIFPFKCRRAIAYYMVFMAYNADGRTADAAQFGPAPKKGVPTMYDRTVADLVMWRDNLQAQLPKRPMFVPARVWYNGPPWVYNGSINAVID